MLVKEILNTDIKPLNIGDTVSAAMLRVDLMHTTQFAVIDDNGVLVGMVSLEHLVELEDGGALLSEIKLSDPVYVPESQHIFEASRMMLAQEVYLLPVTNSARHFKGMLKKKDVLNALGEIFNLSSFGSVISVKMDQIDFTLSDLVRIVELEGAKILGVAVQQPKADNPYYRVSIKLNLEDSSVISSALRRFGYTILSEANSELLEHNISDRADELIRYLDI